MRIALLTYSTKPRGGVVHTLNLAEALADLGADVTVWSLNRSGGEGFFRPVHESVTVQLVPFVDLPDDDVTDRIVRSIETLAQHFDPSSYDIVHAQDCISANAVGPCIRTIHHLDDFITPILAECHEKAVVQPYARICVSQAVADEVNQQWGFSPTVIPNGVDYERFAGAAASTAIATGARQRWRERLGRYVLAVGGIEPRKGSIDLLEAYARLSAEHPDVQLVYAGGETLFDYRGYRSDFERRKDELGVSPTVLGAVEDDELPALVAGCDAFAFPSVKEGFGLAALEALSAGRPVVARDLPILREVFGDTVAYADGVESLAGELGAALDGSVKERASQGRSLAKSLTWASAAKSHLEFYEQHSLATR